MSEKAKKTNTVFHNDRFETESFDEFVQVRDEWLFDPDTDMEEFEPEDWDRYFEGGNNE
ncbi:phage hypothetical protein [Cyanobacterium sp. HL-69]|uniref:hypothetical protein n=1 Tax=Cyanobacterium sp. HL-69 TaxID=2054282 RepID=UPI000CA32824|nr:phage hypothetical protein [Cyanobacterium sp. HL-69]